MIDVELDFLYDLQFTKLPIQYVEQFLASLALRIFCLGSALSSLLAFFFTSKPGIPRVDVVITYCLLGQVILLDLCSFAFRYWSNWMVKKLPGDNLMISLLTAFSTLNRLRSERGIQVMAQHDLISYYVQQSRREPFVGLYKFLTPPTSSRRLDTPLGGQSTLI